MTRPALPTEIVRTGHVAVALPPDAALDLFTAPGEELWVPGWQPRYVSPPDGTPVEGGIWFTPEGDNETFWRVQRFDRATREAEYLRLTPGNRCVTVSVRCGDDGAGGTRAEVTYRAIPLSPAGEAWCAAFTPEAYAAMLAEWARLLAAYLAAR